MTSTDQKTTEPLMGSCRSCGRPLVKVPGERTYHPAVVLTAKDTCPALLPIPGTVSLSFDVPDSEFIPDGTPPTVSTPDEKDTFPRRCGTSPYVRTREKTTFPLPAHHDRDDSEDDIGWRLRYQPDSLTREQRLYAASIIDAYAAFVQMPAPRRNRVVMDLRKVLRDG